MEYYGNNDWRDYLRRQNELAHFGIPKRSGRFPWGSGDNPYHHGSDAPGGKRKKKLQDFTPADNRRIGRATMRYGIVGGLASMHNIKKEGYNPPSKESEYTEVEQDRLARASNSLGAITARYIAGLPGQWAVEDLEKRKIEKDKKLLGDKYKQFSEYSDEQLKRMEEAHNKPHGEERREWYRVMKENSKAIDAARKEARAEQKEAAAKEKQEIAEKQPSREVLRDLKELGAPLSQFDKESIKTINAMYKELGPSFGKEFVGQVYLGKVPGEASGKRNPFAEDHKSRPLSGVQKEKMEKAKSKDVWDLNFMETMQNSKVFWDNDRPKLYEAYEEYLRDPIGFQEDKYKKYT